MHTNEFFSWGGTASRYGRRSSLDGIWMHDDKCLDGASAPIAVEEPGTLAAAAFAGIVAEARLVGVFEHFNDTNFRGTTGASTHYIVHAYRLQLDRADLQLPVQQHSQYLWMNPRIARRQTDVHFYTKAYLQD